MKRIMNDGFAFSGRTFCFFGKAAKPLSELPSIAPSSYIACHSTGKVNEPEAVGELRETVQRVVEKLGGMERYQD